MPKLVDAGLQGGGRLGRGRRVAATLNEINVVPLVDLILVLLIIFMITAPMIQRGIDVNLPVARRAPQITADRPEITVPSSYRRDHIVYLGTEPIREGVFQERIRQKMETATQKDVFLKGDRDVNLGDLMDVFSKLKAAGVEHVGIEGQ